MKKVYVVKIFARATKRTLQWVIYPFSPCLIPSCSGLLFLWPSSASWGAVNSHVTVSLTATYTSPVRTLPREGCFYVQDWHPVRLPHNPHSHWRLHPSIHHYWQCHCSWSPYPYHQNHTGVENLTTFDPCKWTIIAEIDPTELGPQGPVYLPGQ